MRSGDNVYCIRTNDLNKKNCCYKVLYCNKNTVIVTTEKDPKNELQPERKYYLFKQVEQWSKFDDFFITESEYRKLKLQKLNDKFRFQNS